MSELHEVPVQADSPDILIPESTGGISHISSLLEDMPFHGGEELTTGMMHAFIPVAMKSLLKVCLGCQCAVLVAFCSAAVCHYTPCCQPKVK